MDSEIWKNIGGYKGLYQVSNFGKIKRFNKTKQSKPFKILKPIKDRYGYLFVGLSKNSKSKHFYIHKLVLESFIGPCPFGKEVCHNDGNKINNLLSNLRYDTRKNNNIDKIKHGTMSRGSKRPLAKLNDNKILKIRKLHLKGKSNVEIAKIFDVSRSLISGIINYKRWKHVK